MTTAELESEYVYREGERLGIFAGNTEPTPEQRAIAQREAEAAIEELRYSYE